MKKPVAVLSSNDGCIVARSQEVKDLGIPMGIPYFQVKDICIKAGVVLFSSNFPLYRDISSRIMQVLADEVGPCEIYSIDEAFFRSPAQITKSELKEIRDRIFKKVGLPVSIGVASTKTLAKEASVIAKKGNGACVLTQQLWKKQKEITPCSSIWGMGRKTVVKLSGMGVTTVSEFLALDRATVRSHFGVFGERMYMELAGVSVYDIGANSEDVRQSIMSTRSFEKTTRNLHDLESAIAYHVSAAAEKLREKKLLASRLSVVIQASRHGDFFMRRGASEVIFSEPTSHTQTLIKHALVQAQKLFDPEVPYKKAGVILGGLMPASYQNMTLFSGENEKGKHVHDLDAITDALNEKFGHGTIRSGIIARNGARGSAKLRSFEYTTKWKDIPSVQAK